MVSSCSISVINISVSYEDLIASTFLEESELGDTRQRLPNQSRALYSRSCYEYECS